MPFLGGSVWALLFDPIVGRLVALRPDPRSVVTALADDLAAAFLDSVSGLRELAPALHEMRLAAGLSLSYTKCVVVIFRLGRISACSGR